MVPMVVTGHSTNYGYKCVGRNAVISYTGKLDVRGFRADAWSPIGGYIGAY
jgi:hypothetical protein